MAFTEQQRTWQDRYGTRRLADRIDELLRRDHLSDDDRRFVEARDMMFVASVDADGRPTCSYKGGERGFVRALDPRTLAFPSYDGNGMYLTLGNVAATGRVGLLFVDFEQPSRLRVHGHATVGSDDPLRPAWPGAQLVVRVTVTDVFPNCPRYVHRMRTVTRSRFVPRADGSAPVPDWKRTPWAADVLPDGDPARLPAEAP